MPRRSLHAVHLSVPQDCKVLRPLHTLSTYQETSPSLHIHTLWSFFSPYSTFCPASLIKILLLMAGIEPNPGPTNPNCPVCKKIVNWKTKSVFCTKCKAWCHVINDNCSGLKNHHDYNNTGNAHHVYNNNLSANQNLNLLILRFFNLTAMD